MTSGLLAATNSSESLSFRKYWNLWTIMSTVDHPGSSSSFSWSRAARLSGYSQAACECAAAALLALSKWCHRRSMWYLTSAESCCVTTFPLSLPRLDTGPVSEPRSTAETLIYDRWNPKDFLSEDTPTIPLSIPEALPIYTTRHPRPTLTPF